jgi:hypothetical protein
MLQEEDDFCIFGLDDPNVGGVANCAIFAGKLDVLL